MYISQLLRFSRVCCHVEDFNARNKCLTTKLCIQDYRYHKLRKVFSTFYHRHHELVSNFSVGHQGLSEQEFYGDKFKKIMGRADFSDQFRKMIIRHKRIGYNYAPNFEKVGSKLLSACPSVRSFVCPSVRSKKI